MVTQNPLLFSATVAQTASTPPLQNSDEFDLEEIIASLTDLTDTGEDLNVNVFQEKNAGFQLPNEVMRTLNDLSLIVTPPPVPSSGFAAFDLWVKSPQSRGLVDMSNEVQANSSNLQV
jgi:hypothetical protein